MGDCTKCGEPRDGHAHDTQFDSNEVAYFYYQPIFSECTCSCGNKHHSSIGKRYYAKMMDGQDMEISREEYEGRSL